MIAGSAGVRHRKSLRVCEHPVKRASRMAIHLGSFRFLFHSVILADLVDGPLPEAIHELALDPEAWQPH